MHWLEVELGYHANKNTAAITNNCQFTLPLNVITKALLMPVPILITRIRKPVILPTSALMLMTSLIN